MCGIMGFWKPPGFDRKSLRKLVTGMMDAAVHRGPDDDGFYIDEKFGLALGHRRLSIIDLSPLGRQPMKSFNERYVIVYNGEVYNFGDLRKKLEDNFNISFKGNSDTEVILACFEVWGIEETLKKVNGMFAFALWDMKEKRLYLIRDRVGIKPLYYGVQNGILFFASELKSIRANRLFYPEINMAALALFFRHNYIPAPYTIYKNIYKLPPGCFLNVDNGLLAGGSFSPHLSNSSYDAQHSTLFPVRYWDAKIIAQDGFKNQVNLSESEAINELERLLLDAVGKRMIADVPLGAFLSGGLDSSTVVALMQAQSSIPVKTFTIGFYENNYDEARYAKKVAKHLGTDHTELYVTPKEAMEVVPSLPDIYDEPFSDSSQIPTFLVSQLTRKYVTVSLSGDGGDELFGGYNRYFWADNIRNKIKYLPGFGRNLIARMLTMVSPQCWDFLFSKLDNILPYSFKQSHPGDKLHKLSNVLRYKSADDLYRGLVSHWKEPEDLVRNSTEPDTILCDRNVRKIIPDFRDRMMFFDLITYLPDDILTKVDRASMAVSLEARVPILDHRVIEFSKRLPLSLKIKNGKSKWILRQVLNKYVPKELIERPKMGFGIPIDDWLRGPLRGWAENLLNEKKINQDGILNPEPIKELWQEHLSGKRNWQYLLWDVLMFQAWKEKWM